jgi:hypothetical protein
MERHQAGETVEHARVSVVDDDGSVRESLPDLLMEWASIACAFPSAQEFLASGCVNGTGCLILDVALPGMTGIGSPTKIAGSRPQDSGCLQQRTRFVQCARLAPGVVTTPSGAPSLLSSGKAGQVSITGMRPSWTNVLIDGMDANDRSSGFPGGQSRAFSRPA